ncbi:MAG: CBS domain-containing protein [Chloroflexi bacterium]|nr:CBS domain-containing protein [Chloroflexota bacterium]
MKVRDILQGKKQPPITIAPGDTLLAASRLLAEHNVGVLLVVEPDGHPIGVLSERDIVREFARKGGSCEDVPVSEVMTADPIIGEMDGDVSQVASVMTRAHIRHLPIVSEGRLVGLISIRDVVEGQMSASEGEIRRLRAYMNSIP